MACSVHLTVVDIKCVYWFLSIYMVTMQLKSTLFFPLPRNTPLNEMVGISEISLLGIELGSLSNELI